MTATVDAPVNVDQALDGITVKAAEDITSANVPHHDLGGETDPSGADVHQVVNNVESLRWALEELGTNGLSGFMRRRDTLVGTSMIGEDGYIEPDTESAGHKDDHNGPATVRTVTPDTLVGRLAMKYLVYRKKTTGSGDNQKTTRTEIFFPSDSAKHAVQLIDDAPNLQRLRGITHTPVVRKDGSILDIPGYDRASGYLYLPEPGLFVPKVSEVPTTEDLAIAVGWLRGLIDQFTWAGEHDEAAYLGVLLTPLLRLMCPPPYKLIGIMAHQRGSGKSLLAQIIREVHGGVFRSEMPAQEEELEKVISSILSCTTAPVVTIDNVSGVLRSSRLEGMLTSDVYSGRILGSTNYVEMDNDRLWTLTGNNLSLAGDLDRRTLLITIDPMVEKPELRTGFKISNLGEYVVENRGWVIWALLTMVRAWVVAGKQMERRSSDSYAHWSATVRGILKTAGVPGEFDHASCTPEQDSSDPEGWGSFLEAARAAFGDQVWTAKELLDKVHDGRPTPEWKPTPLCPEAPEWVTKYNDEHPISLDVLPGDLSDKFSRNGAAGVSRSLGMWLRNHNRRFGGKYAGVESGSDTTKTKLWRVLNSAEMQAERAG